MPCRHLPRTRFAQLPTPLEAAPRLSEALGGPEILVKREDLSGLAFGGNKTRLMEYVIGDALERGINAVVAAASPQSNKLREVAAAAARFGMTAVVLVDGRAPAQRQGNLLLLELLGAEVRFLHPGQDVLAAQREVQAELERAGRRVALLDRRLEYGALATAAYVDAARELVEQLADRRLEPERMVAAVGAGMTLAGLTLGLKHLGSRTRVVGVSVSGAAAAVAPEVVEHARRATETLGLAATISEADFTLVDGAHPGYGLLSPDVAETIRLVARHHGMVLDPVYNAKTMRALVEQIRRGEVGPRDTVIFVNTGGAPALFAHQADLESG